MPYPDTAQTKRGQRRRRTHTTGQGRELRAKSGTNWRLVKSYNNERERERESFDPRTFGRRDAS